LHHEFDPADQRQAKASPPRSTFGPGGRLIQTAKLNGVDPQAQLAAIHRRIADTPQTQLAELLPWNWRSENSRQKAA
jgi:hypothetical protein